MERVAGRVLTDLLLPGFTSAERHAVYMDLARVLAALHTVDVRAVGLADFGRPGNYYERQISRWSKQYVASKTEEIPAMEKLMTWLPAHIPPSDETVIVHGDYRLGNVLLHPTEPQRLSYLEERLEGRPGPVSAASDWVRAVPEQIRPFVPARYRTLGTDGFGRSDGRERLRHHFEVNRFFIAIAALKALSDDGRLPPAAVKQAIEKYGTDPDKPDPVRS